MIEIAKTKKRKEQEERKHRLDREKPY